MSRTGGIAAAAVIVVLTLAWRILTFAGFNNDHYVHLARAQQLVLGDLPVRDFVDPGMPLMYLVSAAVWWVWGGSVWTELCLVGAGFALGAACTFMVARRLSGSFAVAAGATLLELLIAPRLYSYPKILLYAAAAWAIVALIDTPSRRRVVMLAALTGTAFLFRHDHGVYIGAAAAVAVMLATAPLGWRVAGQRLAILAGAAALFVAPWLGFVAYHQGLAGYLSSGVEFSSAEARTISGVLSVPAFRLSPGEGLLHLRPPHRPSAIVEWKPETPDATRRELERRYGLEAVAAGDDPPREYYGNHSSPETMRALADDPHVSDVSGLDRFVEWSRWDAMLARLSPSRLQTGGGWHVDENSHVWLYYMCYVLPIVCALVAWRRRITTRQGWPGESAAVGALAALAIIANVGLLRDNLQARLPDAIAPAVVLGAWLVPVAWRAGRGGPRRMSGRAALLGVVTGTAAAVAVVGDLNSQIDRSRASQGIDGISARAADLRVSLQGRHRDAGSPPSSVSEALLPFFEYLDRCTTRRDRLVMTHLYPDVFVMAERGFAGGHVAFIEDFYSSAAEQERTLARLRAESVPFILLIREEEFRRGFGLLSAYVDRNYEPLTSIPVERTAELRVLVEKRRPARRMDDETGWPCFT